MMTAPRMLLATLLLAAPAVAQTSRPEAPTTAPAETTTPTSLLSGPSVSSDDADPSQPTFGGRRQGRRSVTVRPQRWIELFRGLELDEKRQRDADVLISRYAQTLRGFRRANGAELRAVRKAVNEAGGEPSPELRAKLKALEKKRPSPVETQKKLWALLDLEQRDAFRARLDEEKRRMAKEMRKRREGRDGGGRQRAEDEDDDVTRRRLRFLRSRRSGDGA